MKAAVVRDLAERHGLSALEQAAEAIAEREVDELGVEGEDLGEKLTHLMLAARIRRRIDAGEDAKTAFRAEMGGVRDLLKNG
ncbi:MAG: hypothetical protein H6738_05950 [Alphaproteobacteria bacterium]|nr:hypothetical protein [Alphaproteobacteria bacterium]MCB9696309.1 hypothetical protein [Alphaproteobacteria bacterium]